MDFWLDKLCRVVGNFHYACRQLLFLKTKLTVDSVLGCFGLAVQANFVVLLSTMLRSAIQDWYGEQKGLKG